MNRSTDEVALLDEDGVADTVNPLLPELRTEVRWEARANHFVLLVVQHSPPLMGMFTARGEVLPVS